MFYGVFKNLVLVLLFCFSIFAQASMVTASYDDLRARLIAADAQKNWEEAVDILFTLLPSHWDKVDGDRPVHRIAYKFGLHLKRDMGWRQNESKYHRLEINTAAQHGLDSFYYVLKRLKTSDGSGFLQYDASKPSIRQLVFRDYMAEYYLELDFGSIDASTAEKIRSDSFASAQEKKLAKAISKQAKEIKSMLTGHLSFDGVHKLQALLKRIERAKPSIREKIDSDALQGLDIDAEVSRLIGEVRAEIDKLNVPETKFPLPWPNIFVEIAKVDHPKARKFLEHLGRDENLRPQLRVIAYSNLVYIAGAWNPFWIVALHTLSQCYLGGKSVSSEYFSALKHIQDVLGRWWSAEPNNQEIISAIKKGLPTLKKVTLQPPTPPLAGDPYMAHSYYRMEMADIRANGSKQQVLMSMTIRTVPIKLNMTPYEFSVLALKSKSNFTEDEWKKIEPTLDPKACSKFLSRPDDSPESDQEE